MTLKHALFALSVFTSVSAQAGTITQENLTSDGTIQANNTDPNLKNPWGITFSPSGPFWVSDNASGLATVYNTAGQIQSLVVTVPSANGKKTGSPTGQVYNPSSTDFAVTENGTTGPAAFLFDSEDGTISGWAPSVDPSNAVIAVDLSAKGAVFKGLAYYTDAKGNNFLFAADLNAGVVDEFDSTFKLVNSFRDKTLESVYAPHNIAILNGNIYVAYAWVNGKRNGVIPHPGWGVVEQIDPTGKVLAKAAGGKLNAPWGLAIAPASFGHYAGDLLVGNFGNGHISAFSTTLVPKGDVMSAPKTPLVIDGLWGLIVGNGGGGGSKSDIYFTAGPNHQTNGLFGSLSYSKPH
jgi:uncharacterized protein (TIGR03118 family)